MYKIVKWEEHLQVSNEEAINRALETFGTNAADVRALKVWCYLLANDELVKVPGLNYASIDSVLERLKDMGWVIIENDIIYPVAHKEVKREDVIELLETWKRTIEDEKNDIKEMLYILSADITALIDDFTKN